MKISRRMTLEVLITGDHWWNSGSSYRLFGGCGGNSNSNNLFSGLYLSAGTSTTTGGTAAGNSVVANNYGSRHRIIMTVV